MKQVLTLAALVTLAALMTASVAEAVSNAAVLYLRIAAGARPAGMGEAFVSIADDATSTFWNPAGLGNSPIAGTRERQQVPVGYGEISDAVTINGADGSSHTWVIAGGRLLMFDGKRWTTGTQYMTSSDQTIYDFVRTIFNTDDEKQLQLMADQVVAANSPITMAEVQNFVDTVRTVVPEDYADMEELQRGLDTLVSSYRLCLLRPGRFRDLQNKLKDGLKDGALNSDEMDRITFSIDGTVMRFLPGHLEVPYSAGVIGSMNCLGGVGSYVWVGTNDGAFRKSGHAWARYTTADGLPSDTVLSMAGEEQRLFIGTQRGIVQYLQGSFTSYPNIPASPVTRITVPSGFLAYAAVDGVIYRLDGSEWSESFSYKVRIDDDLDKLIDRISIYHTPSEYEYLKNRIIELNAGNVPRKEEAGVKTADEDSAGVTAESADADSTAEAILDEMGATDSLGLEETAGESEDMEQADDQMEITESAPAYPWLVEGNQIQLPNSPRLPYDVTALHVDLFGELWVGTSAGLLSFSRDEWTVYGYDRYVVPVPDSGSMTWTAADIARTFLKTADSTKVAALAENIDVYNDLDGNPVAPGDTVYVYQRNIGSTITAIGEIYGDLYVGTEFGPIKRTSSGWEAVDISGSRGDALVAIYQHEGMAHFITNDRVTVETDGRDELVLMAAPWLQSLDVDMYYGYLSFVHNMRGLGTFGLSVIYLTYGSITFTNEDGVVIGEESPYEFTMAGSFGTSLNSNLKLGITGKLIYSHLSSIGAGKEQGEGIAWAVAFDAGMLLKLSKRWQMGAALTNIGPDISYIDAAQADPLPRNLAVGISCKVWDTPYNRLIIQGELNKILVGLNRSFGKELELAHRHIGAEYWYSDLLALRAGYKYDKEGEVKHLTFGAGLQIRPLRIDFAYIPSSIDSPLANTPRYSFTLMF